MFMACLFDLYTLSDRNLGLKLVLKLRLSPNFLVGPGLAQIQKSQFFGKSRFSSNAKVPISCNRGLELGFALKNSRYENSRYEM